MPIQHSTANDAHLAARREAFIKRHKVRDFKLSGRSLMRLVRSRCVDKALVDEIRARFTHHYGTDLQMECRTWDHLEMFGRDGQLVALVAHPYHVTAEGRGDMTLLHRAHLNVIEAGTHESWYGFGTTQIRVEHPWLAGQMLPPPKPVLAPKPVEHVPTRPASPAACFPAETPYERRLRLAGPALLALAKDRAAELAAAIALIPCPGPRAVTTCVSCEMRVELDRINALIHEVEGPRR